MEGDRAATNLGPQQTPEAEQPPAEEPRQPRKRFIGQRAAAERAARKAAQHVTSTNTESSALTNPKPTRTPRILNQIPREILEDPALKSAIALLPSNYNFEIQKTIHRVRSSGAKNIALQFPEGLLMFAPLISDILTQFCPGTDTLIMGDVTYGACCVDDYTARALGCDLLVHYGHSCLVPMDQTGGIKTLYVFVTIGIDVEHLIRTVEANFPSSKKIALVGTIQFNSTLQSIAPRLRNSGYEILIPRSAPLSAGEILGCTAPTLTSRSTQRSNNSNAARTAADGRPALITPNEADMILYVGDGRFHLESIMIASPTLRANTYRYDPYSRRLTHETYEHEEMHSLRRAAIRSARRTLRPARNRGQQHQQPRTWGIILGTLGRQGNPHTLSLIEAHLDQLGVEHVTLLLSEIQPGKMALMSADVGVWVQIACPRLSIDWGYAFERPLLSPYEACVALGIREGGEWMGGEATGEDVDATVVDGQSEGTKARTGVVEDAVYPMDFYGKDGLGRTRPEDVPTFAAREIEVR